MTKWSRKMLQLHFEIPFVDTTLFIWYRSPLLLQRWYGSITDSREPLLSLFNSWNFQETRPNDPVKCFNCILKKTFVDTTLLIDIGLHYCYKDDMVVTGSRQPLLSLSNSWNFQETLPNDPIKCFNCILKYHLLIPPFLFDIGLHYCYKDDMVVTGSRQPLLPLSNSWNFQETRPNDPEQWFNCILKYHLLIPPFLFDIGLHYCYKDDIVVTDTWHSANQKLLCSRTDCLCYRISWITLLDETLLKSAFCLLHSQINVSFNL